MVMTDARDHSEPIISHKSWATQLKHVIKTTLTGVMVIHIQAQEDSLTGR